MVGAAVPAASWCPVTTCRRDYAISARSNRTFLCSRSMCIPYLGPQGNERCGLDLVAGNKSQLPALRERGQQQHAFHARKRLADALLLPRAKREIAETQMFPLALRRKPFGFEAQRIGKVPGVAMHHPLAHQHRCSRGQKEWPQMKIIKRLAAHRPGGRKQTHCSVSSTSTPDASCGAPSRKTISMRNGSAHCWTKPNASRYLSTDPRSSSLSGARSSAWRDTWQRIRPLCRYWRT